MSPEKALKKPRSAEFVPLKDVSSPCEPEVVLCVVPDAGLERKFCDAMPVFVAVARPVVAGAVAGESEACSPVAVGNGNVLNEIVDVGMAV